MPPLSARCWPRKRWLSGERSVGPQRQSAGWHAGAQWAQIEAAAPRVAAVVRRYLRQLGTFLAPASVDAAENALRQLAPAG